MAGEICETAFLESLYLAAGAGPALSFKLKAWRGLGDRVQFSSGDESLSELWRDLFYNFADTKAAKILLKGYDVQRSLSIRFEPPEAMLLPPLSDIKEFGSPSPIVFEWFRGKRLIKSVRPTLENNQLRLEGTPEIIKIALYASNAGIPAYETVNWFSTLSKRGAEASIARTIHEIFPFITDLSVEIHARQPMVHADLKERVSEKIPLGLVSGGVNKIFAILCAIAHQRVVLIDEIENGFYYTILPQVWASLYKAAKEHDTQLFVSSHSLECIRAVLDTAQGNESDFCLLRTGREGNRSVINQFDGKSFLAAVEKGGEVR